MAGKNRRDIHSKNPYMYEQLSAGDTVGEVAETSEVAGPGSLQPADYGRYTRGMARLGPPKQYSYTPGDNVARVHAGVAVPVNGG